MILDLTTPLNKKYSYKDTSQREAWGSSIFLDSLFYLIILKRVIGEYFPKRKNENWFRTWYPSKGSLTLGALSYLHVWTSSGRSILKLGTALSHGWVERGSSQVIGLSIQRSDLFVNFLILGIWVCTLSTIEIASSCRYEVLDFSLSMSSTFYG